MSGEAGESTRETRSSKGRHQVVEPVEGSDERDSELEQHLHETRSDSENGAGEPRQGHHHTRALRRRRLVARGVPAHSKERGTRRRQAERCGVRGRSGGEPPVAARPREVGDVPSATGAARIHPEGWEGDAAARHPDVEDKVLQRAITMLLEAVYEQDFMDCSYGFRPQRSARDALETMRTAAVVGAGGWVVEIDIWKFFDSVDRKVLKEVLRQRVRDGVVLRLVSKWLAAGVMEDGAVTRPTSGTPQGGVVSPILANILLHDVLDLWFERDVRPRLRQRGTLVRYADDAVMVFSNEEDARRVLEVLPKRFGRFGLALHPEKTKMVAFERPDRPSLVRQRRRGFRPDKPGTFDFLGFTILWEKSLAGKWVVRARTSKSRFRRTLKNITECGRMHRHHPVDAQQRALNQKLRGHYAYFGRQGNIGRLWEVWNRTRQIWRRWLSRRSQKAKLNWPTMVRLLERYPLVEPNQVALRSESPT
ncbi:MAG: reverse transcriptase domain-containing protein [Polyangiaceae bacterium]